MRRTVSMVLCMVMLLMVMNTGVAEESIQPRYSYTAVISVLFDLTAGIARVAGEIEPSGNYASRITVHLQKRGTGAWQTIATWHGESDSCFSEAGGSREVPAGYSYRVYAIGRVYDSDGTLLERVTKYSPVKQNGTVVG